MTLALRRFALDGIGPPGARFDPLTVDLRVDGTAARTAVLFLENGGGKSVLLRLLFAVVLPGRRYTVGSVKLDGYVGSGDTGHAALEWDTPDRPLVTGLVLEWRNRTRSASSSNLLPLWYSFVPRAGVLTLDDLPTRDGDRRVTRAGFRDRLTALAREHPELELVVEDQPTKWADHLLRATPIDPEIFRYQRQMNADEADAESLFAGLRSDDDFVRFVVEAVHDPDQLNGFEELLAEYAAQLGRRHELELEARFCAEAAAALRPLADAAAERARAEAAAVDARRGAEGVRARLAAGADQADRRAQLRQERAERVAARAEQAAVDAKRIAEVAAELRRLEARFRYDDAVAAERRATAEAEAAALEVAAWEHAGAVVDARRLAGELAELHRAQEQAASDLEPLRRAAEAAAARYAGRLLDEADALDAAAERARDDAAAADRRAAELAADAAAAERDAGAAGQEAEGLRARMSETEAAVAEARAIGLVGPAETVGEAARRAERERAEAGTELARARQRRRSLEGERGRVAGDLGRVRGDEARDAARLDAARTELDGHVAAARALVGHPRVQEIAPGAEDAWLVLDRLEQVLDASVQAAEAADRSLRHETAAVDDRLERLGADGLLPAAPDVVRVWDALVVAGIPATTGWSWLANNRDDEGRARALATNPALAGGVIVVDPDRVEEAWRALAAAGVETESVVVVGTADQLDEPGAGRAAPVRPALYDPGWTERTRAALEAERAELVERQAAAREALGTDAPLLAQARDLRRRCPADRRDRLAATVAELDEAVRAHRAELDRLAERERSLAEEIAELDRTEPDLEDRAGRAAEAAARLAALARDEAAAQEWAVQAADAERRRDRHRERAGARAAEAERERAAAEAGRAAARQAAADAHQRREEAARTSDRPARAGAAGVDEAAGADEADTAEEPDAGVEPADPDVSTAELEGAAAATRRAYEAERDGRDLTPQIEQAERTLADRQARLADLAPDVRAAAEAAAGQPGADDPAARRSRLEAARHLASIRAATAKECQEELGAARHALEERSPSGGRARFAALDPADEPADAAAAARAAAEHQSRSQARTQESRQARAEAEALGEEAREAANRARLLRAALDVLPAPAPADAPAEGPAEGPDPGPDGGPGAEAGAGDGAAAAVAPWDGPVEDAREAARAARARLDESRAAVAAAERALEVAATAVRAVANDPTLAAVSGVRVALANEPVDSLAGRAETLAGELDAMRESVEHEQADILRHREGIVQRLATFVEAHLRQLRLLTRLSTLPPGLGEWSGKPFVAVDFEPVSGAEITARLGPVVDEAAADPRKRRALDLVMAGMRAAVAQQKGDTEKTFTVRLLRPNRTMTYLRASIDELGREFSGGMKLTAAICTYCALAALRANSRSAGSLFGHEPGPLFLDNPLGKASADYLLDLQHAIAEKLRVQLVHTTGVWDVEALATYDRVVRLRNLADLRRNVRRLRVDDDIHLPGRGATIDAVGIGIRRDAS
ncbi:MAG TPA: hypothetical protein VIL48_09845 [Acidimicrobiales bacterium]